MTLRGIRFLRSAEVGRPLVLKARNGSGDFTGGDSANTMTWRTYYVLEPDFGASPAACGTSLFTDDYESGAALSSDYDTVVDMVKTSGIGVSGTQGIEGSGTDSQKYYAELWKDVAPNSRQGCVTFWVKPIEAIDQSGHYFIEIHADNSGVGSNAASAATVLGIYSGGSFSGSPSFGDITLYTEGSTELDSATGVYSDGVYAKLNLQFQLSSVTAGSRNADGWAQVRINDALVIDATGLTIGVLTNNANNYWGGFRIAPQGVGDNLGVAT